ncbi:hypothetical protein AJGP001_10805 [Planococcus faecalis]|uniref:DUF4054 domain-containing protein n=3 Tax=Planococcus faecalis TaxID=1598147 RepID=A0ABN4XVE5_9BACL|nr:hypothetical protein AJGP001_10805 [Planococcus faecalis]
MDFAKTDAYLLRLSGAENYKALTPVEKEEFVFTAYERLSLYYAESMLTPKVVALQTLYMTKSASVDGEEGVALQNIRKAGAKSYSLEGVSVTFDDNATGDGIAPDVLAYFELLESQKSRARVGRLV